MILFACELQSSVNNCNNSNALSKLRKHQFCKAF